MKIILFDLEETLIEDWNVPTLLCEQFPKIKEWIAKEGEFQSGIFSWAIWDQKDLTSFNKELRGRIEESHNIHFNDNLIFLRDDILKSFREWFHMPFMDSDDFMAFFKKRQAIEELWLRHFNQPDTELVFLDDTVPNMVCVISDVKNNILRLVNSKDIR